jgi:hypothetical protein
MSDHKNQQISSAEPPTSTDSQRERKPYHKPGFIVSRAFERQALSCAGCINTAAGFPSYCSNQSG